VPVPVVPPGTVRPLGAGDPALAGSWQRWQEGLRWTE